MYLIFAFSYDIIVSERCDTVKNIGSTDTPLEILYHCNTALGVSRGGEQTEYQSRLCPAVVYILPCSERRNGDILHAALGSYIQRKNNSRKNIRLFFCYQESICS